MGGEDVRDKVTSMLVAIFGERFKNTLREFYSDASASELKQMAYEMLCDYMGVEKAKMKMHEVFND